ncbi:MAG: hypothetical protein HOJ65_04200 [Verrucomicrobia bacterium]|nr:hypothetical protein [Verrucomicrobiota bacterium]
MNRREASATWPSGVKRGGDWPSAVDTVLISAEQVLKFYSLRCRRVWGFIEACLMSWNYRLPNLQT